MPGRAQAHGQRDLSGGGVGVDVAQVVHHQQGAGQQADRDRSQHCQARQPLELDVGRPGRRHEPEEHQDGELTEPGVAVRLGPAGVERAGGDAGDADEQQTEVDGEARNSPATAARAKAMPAALSTLRRGHQPRRRESLRADPLGVRAAAPVRIVVGVVGADLEGQCHHHRRQRPPGDDGAFGGGHGRADQDRGDGGGQRAGRAPASQRFKLGDPR